MAADRMQEIDGLLGRYESAAVNRRTSTAAA